MAAVCVFRLCSCSCVSEDDDDDDGELSLVTHSVMTVHFIHFIDYTDMQFSKKIKK